MSSQSRDIAPRERIDPIARMIAPGSMPADPDREAAIEAARAEGYQRALRQAKAYIATLGQMGFHYPTKDSVEKLARQVGELSPRDAG